ncbi:exonuclease domain-containing protein [Methylobacterium fujisawaense]|uniref:exonuclease domain-containing protein n=1 Tax=Methylobacterium fujisawaense TaxID=107400 RepID=UPI0031F540E5
MNSVAAVAPPGAAFHPADELAYVRAEMDRLTGREIALTRALVADRESRVGSLHHAVVQRVSGRDAVDIERLPDLRETLRLLETTDLVALDTETTGLHALDGDRVVSVGLYPCHVAKGRLEAGFQHLDDVGGDNPYRAVVNPGRPSSPQAAAVHGLTDEFLATKPAFSQALAADIYDIIHARVVIAHNAPFDVGFMEMECERVDVGFREWPAAIVDTRILCKILWPDQPGTLDALIDRLGVNRQGRVAGHDALRDAVLLAECIPGLVAELRRRVA